MIMIIALSIFSIVNLFLIFRLGRHLGILMLRQNEMDSWLNANFGPGTHFGSIIEAVKLQNENSVKH